MKEEKRGNHEVAIERSNERSNERTIERTNERTDGRTHALSAAMGRARNPPVVPLGAVVANASAASASASSTVDGTQFSLELADTSLPPLMGGLIG